MKTKEFLAEIALLAESLRANIEAELTGWDDRPESIEARRKKVFDKTDGFEYFVQNYFPHYIRNPAKSQLHRYLFGLIPQILNDKESCNDVLAAPRGEAKSTICSQLYPLYCVVTGKKKNIPIISSTFEVAAELLEGIKAELEANTRIKIDFPNVFGEGRTWNAGTIVTRNLIKLRCYGAGKKLRGVRFGAYRPDLIIIDDIENDENVQKPEQREKLNDWLKKAVLPMIQAGEKGDVLYIGTVLHYDSVLSRTLKNSLWRSKTFKAILRWPDDMSLWDKWEEILKNNQDEGKLLSRQFYAQNKKAMDAGAVVSWAARPILELMEIRARDGHATFDSEYQNDPVSGEDALFNGCIQYWADTPQDLILFGACDPSLGKHGKNRDPSAILVGGYHAASGKLYVLEAAIKKRLPDKIISDIITLQKQYHCHVWFIEAVQFQEFLRTELIRRSAKQGNPVPARAVTPHTDKMLRIESLQPHVDNGLILLHSSQSTLISQLEHFPKADHDDGPDALHMLWAGAVSHGVGSQSTAINVPAPTL